MEFNAWEEFIENGLEVFCSNSLEEFIENGLETKGSGEMIKHLLELVANLKKEKSGLADSLDEKETLILKLKSKSQHECSDKSVNDIYQKK